MTVDWVDADAHTATVHAVDESVPNEFVAKRTLGIGFWLSVGWIVFIISLAFLAPVLPLKNPRTNFTGTGNAGPNASPSLEHWFGTDEDALDVFSRTVWGARISLVVGFSAIAFGMIVGGSLGMIAGFVRGWFDRIVSFLFLNLLSFPALVLAILLTALLNRSLTTISLVLGVLAVAPVGRLSRSATLVYAEREFVMAARTVGAKNSRILVRELLPNVIIPMGALALLGMAVAIVAEGSLAFLGLSVEQSITWGNLIQRGASGRRTLENAPWIALAPIGVLFLTVLALNYAGDRIRDYFDVKELSL
jgi:peptide/nickel transport system permease protein